MNKVDMILFVFCFFRNVELIFPFLSLFFPEHIV